MTERRTEYRITRQLFDGEGDFFPTSYYAGDGTLESAEDAVRYLAVTSGWTCRLEWREVTPFVPVSDEVFRIHPVTGERW